MEEKGLSVGLGKLLEKRLVKLAELWNREDPKYTSIVLSESFRILGEWK